MKNNVDVSVVLITHDNYALKHGCIETVILAVKNQQDISKEIIVVDNCSGEEDRVKLENFITQLDGVKYIYNDINNISRGRNIGAKMATAEVVVFMDDDTLLTDEMSLKTLLQQASNSAYGYGAVRLWTQPGFYEENRLGLNNKLLLNKSIKDGIIAGEPDPQIRKKNNTRHLMRSYIGNFGFITKAALQEVSWWDDDYEGYGVEDDTMALKLYIKYGRPAVLKGIEVVHIWHDIKEKNYNQLSDNQNKFNRILKNNGIKIFHVGRLLYDEDKEILEMMEGRKMNNLFILCGKPGSGKTTLSHMLKKEYGAVHFSADNFMLKLFGEIQDREVFNEKLKACKELIYEISEELLPKTDVVLDFGFWTRQERDYIRERFKYFNVQLVYLKLDDETIFQRIENRNSNLKDNEYYMDRNTYDFLSSMFEEPVDEKVYEFTTVEDFKEYVEQLTKRR